MCVGVWLVAFCFVPVLGIQLVAGGEEPRRVIAAGEITTLVGSVEKTWDFGRYGYGENPVTDEIEHYLVLRVTLAIDVRDKELGDAKAVTRIQLVLSRESDAWKTLATCARDELVSIKGKLSVAITGHHHEPALMVVESAARYNSAALPDRKTSVALYAESITGSFEQSGPGPRLYVVGDDLAADIKKYAPTIARYVRGKREFESMPTAAKNAQLVYRVDVTRITMTDEGVHALADFYAGPENAIVYLIALKRVGSQWKRISFSVEAVA